MNSIRYRGYYYDQETGLYYLQSRYYDPTTGRFINADDSSVLDSGQGSLIEGNLFAYCLNNPVMNNDPSGYFCFTKSNVFGFFAGAAGQFLAIDSVCWPGFRTAIFIATLAVVGWQVYLAVRTYRNSKKKGIDKFWLVVSLAAAVLTVIGSAIGYWVSSKRAIYHIATYISWSI